MLDVRGLKVTFAGATTPALRGIDLRLDKAKMVVVGANGSGKTTLIRAVLGLVPATAGSIAVDGKDVRTIRGEPGLSTNLAEIYRLMSLPVRDLVRLFALLKGGDPAEMEGHLRAFELDPVLGKRLYELSTGQQKLVGDLFAVCFGPRLILLDEPFDNVDFARRRRLVGLLRALPADILLNTHELELLGSFADWQLGLMFEGQLLGPFSVAELDRLYLTRGNVPEALAVLRTSVGLFSVTRDAGDRLVKSATSLTALVESLA